MTLTGVDVSHHQGVIYWPAVAKSGRAFAFVKATEGLDYTDVRHEVNVSNAMAAGLAVGSYHFADVTADPITQARHHAHEVGGLLPAGRLPSVLDLEGSPRNDTVSKKQLDAWVAAFLPVLDRLTGRTTLLYTGLAFLRDRLDGGAHLLERRGLWIARYGAKPDVPHLFWQHTSSGKVDGINGPVDLNLFSLGREQLGTLASVPHAPAPAPRPVARPAAHLTAPATHLEDPVAQPAWLIVGPDRVSVFATDGVTRSHVTSTAALKEGRRLGIYTADKVKVVSAELLASIALVQ